MKMDLFERIFEIQKKIDVITSSKYEGMEKDFWKGSQQGSF